MLPKIFHNIYQSNAWRSHETVSGGGSELARTEEIRRELPVLLKHLEIKTMLDAGCGDWHWMGTLDLAGIKVSACDIVPEIIVANKQQYSGVDFFIADITSDELPKVDLVLCRATLFHLSFANIQKALSRLFQCSDYVLTTIHPNIDANQNITDGGWRRLNLMKAPFNLPPPDVFFYDGPGKDGGLGLWRKEAWIE